MLRNFVLFLGAVIAWAIFGAIIAVISAMLVLGFTWYRSNHWGINTLLLGAAWGVFIGLGVGVLGLAAANAQYKSLEVSSSSSLISESSHFYLTLKTPVSKLPWPSSGSNMKVAHT